MPVTLTCLAQTRSAICVSASITCRPPLLVVVAKRSGFPLTTSKQYQRRPLAATAITGPPPPAGLLPQFTTRNVSVRCKSSTSIVASATSSMPSLVSASWLKEHLGKPGLKVLDGTWYMPGAPNNPIEEFKADRIPGDKPGLQLLPHTYMPAQRTFLLAVQYQLHPGRSQAPGLVPRRVFHLSRVVRTQQSPWGFAMWPPDASMFLSDAIADKASGLPHMLPSPEMFASAVSAMGISNDSHVVVYDRHGVFSAPRVWWTFRVMGHDAVSVLEGGLPAWKAAGGELETSPISEPDFARRGIDPVLSADGCPYMATKNDSKVRALQQVWNNIEKKSDQVVDARSSGRFYGTAPEPRPGMRGGHIPGSSSVPFDEVLLEGKSGLKSPEEIKAIFSGAGVDLDSRAPIVASCGSGMTACILALALDQIGRPLTSIYDGSWMEWGTNQEVPVVTED